MPYKDRNLIKGKRPQQEFTSTHSKHHLVLKKKAVVQRSILKNAKVYVKVVKNFETDNELAMIHKKYAVKKKNIIITYYYKPTVNKIAASKVGSKLELFGRYELNFNNNNKSKLLLQYWVTKSPLLRSDLGLFISYLKGGSIHINLNAQRLEEYLYEVDSNLNRFYSENLLEEVLLRNYLKNQQSKKKIYRKFKKK